MTRMIVIFHKSFRLAAIERPSGGYAVEITPVAGGKPVLPDAIDAGRRYVDDLDPNHPIGPQPSSHHLDSGFIAHHLRISSEWDGSFSDARSKPTAHR
jgi:hypothetical protein